MAKDDSAHIVNIGRLVEDMEGKMRNMLQEVYFGKTKDVVGDLRSKYFHSAPPPAPNVYRAHGFEIITTMACAAVTSTNV